MAVTIQEAYIQTFENNVRHVAQQRTAKLRGFCQTVGGNSQSHNWPKLGVIEASDKSTRLQDTPVADAAWAERTSLIIPFDAGESTEQEDPTQMLVDPNSNLVQALGMGMERKVDDRLITAATADALNGDGTTTVYNWADQSVGDYTGAISFDSVTRIQENFMESDIDPEVPKVAVVGPTQVRQLMNLTEQTSSDYVQAQALQAYGIVPNWLGFTWINSTRLLAGGDTGGGAGTKDCLFMTQRALGLHVAKDITARVAEDPSKSFAWRLYCFAHMGAIRIEDEQLVVGKFLDS